MPQVAAVRSLEQAVRVIKQMQHASPEWMPDLHELGRKAPRRVLTGTCRAKCGATWWRRPAKAWPIIATARTGATC